MGSIVWAGFLAFFVASLTVGVRLLLLWRRTRELPECLIGIAVLGIGPVGFGGLVAGTAMIRSGADPGSAAVALTMALGTLAVYVGIMAKCVFNWQVYRPGSRSVRVTVIAIGLLLAGLYLHMGIALGFVPPPTPDGPGLLQSGLQVGCLLWGSVEALRYWRKMRRRAAIGLSDPIVTNRFLLWGIGAAAAGGGTAVGTVASVVSGAPSLEIPWVVASSSAHGMLAAVAMWLAFVPPRQYLGWIARSDHAVER
jgi:hypothetical protein